MGKINCCSGSNQKTSYSSVNNDDEGSPINWKKIAIISGIVLFSILFLLFVLVWIVFPLVFMSSKSVQRFFLFLNFNSPKNPEFDNPEKYGIQGVQNFYITVRDLDNSTLLSIGAWMISPEDEIETTRDMLRKYQTIDTSAVADVLRNTDKPILLYMHGVACNRIKATKPYGVFRKYFLVISIDHRGYGDSGPDVELSELGVVNDAVQVYKWIRSSTDNEIFIWGHSLGAALNLHTARRLRLYDDIVPMGVMLESPFSTMRDEVYSVSLTKYFRWLAYFNATFLDPLPKNGFHFESTSNILQVDCPIMIVHAEDDDVIPYRLGRKLYDTAVTQRRNDQGNVTYHLLPPNGYKHNDCVDDPNIYGYIEDFLKGCRAANMMRN